MSGRRKVKTGCVTCKKRRVKCDEVWPICHRCRSTGRICDGYGIWGGGGNAHGSAERVAAVRRSQAPRHANSPLGSVPHSLSQLPNLKGAREVLAFDFFWHRTTIKLVGIFESTFWKSLVLQACLEEPAVLHAVVAAGAAHRKQETLTLQQYNKAITLLSRGHDQQDQLATRLTLTISLIFTCVELLRGDFHAGHLHVQKGLQILGEHLNDGPINDSSTSYPRRVLKMPDDLTDAQLLEAFLPLNLQADMFGFDYCFSLRLSSSSTLDTPCKFSSLRQARLQLLKLLNAIHGLSAQAAWELSTGAPLSATLELLKQDLQFALLGWQRALYNSRQDLFASATGSMAREALTCYHLLATLQVDTSLRGSDEMAFDKHRAVFVAILQRIQILWDMAVAEVGQSIARGVKLTGFTIDIGFIPPLYFTAIKCRDPILRRKALHMLVDTSHREGTWDGFLVARIARHVVRLEEGKFYDTPIDASGGTRIQLPRKARFNSVRVVPLTQCPGSRMRLVLRRRDIAEGSRILETICQEIDIANDGPPSDYPIPKRRLT